MAPYQVSLEQFTGPLDLLLHLIRVNEMDIFDLNLALITDEYLHFIATAGVRDLADAYHFLAMAATLVELKSRLLLPQQRDAEDAAAEEEAPPDPRRQLAQQLAAYQSIQEATQELATRYTLAGRHWPRQVIERLEREIVYSMDDLSVYDLMTSFEEVLSRPRFKQITIFATDYDVDQARDWLRERLGGGAAALAAVLLEQANVFALIVTFVALLEMIKEGEAAFAAGDEGIVLSLAAVEAE